MTLTDKQKRNFYSRYIQKGPDDCWPWFGCIDNGYGRIKIKGKSILAHHIAFILSKKSLPLGYIRHKCNNRACVNPNHLVDDIKKEQGK